MHILFLIFSSALAELSDYLPQQIRLSWSDDEDSMVVTWASESLTYFPEVRYSPVESPEVLVTEYLYSAKGRWQSFRNDPEDTDSRLLHVCSATMNNLIPHTYYTYIVGDPEFGWSSPYTFVSRRDSLDSEARFLVIADLGTGVQAADTIASLVVEAESYKYDGLIHAGDLAYDMNSDDGRNGDLYFRSLEPVIARMPYFVSHGNHESWSAGSQEHFKYRLNMPGDSEHLYYSINQGPAHFIFWTSEPYIQDYTDLEEEMTDFINQDLGKLNRTIHPWVISIEHRPFLCSPEWLVSKNMKERNKYCVTKYEQIRKQYEYLFYKHSVDLHIFGHGHAYERLAPSFDNKTVPSEYDDLNMHVNPKAPVVLVVGNAGQQEKYTPQSSTPLPFSMSSSGELGYGRLIVYNDTNLRFEMVRSGYRRMIDHVDILKEGVYEANLEPEDSSLGKIVGVLILLIFL